MTTQYDNSMFGSSISAVEWLQWARQWEARKEPKPTQPEYLALQRQPKHTRIKLQQPHIAHRHSPKTQHR